MDNQLAEATEQLYRIFSRYRRPEKIECCPCGCTHPDATAHLIAVPLADLRFSDLLDYCFSAISTQGSVNDFKYLLPRLFKGVAEEPCGCNVEILFGKLRLAEWLKWPADELLAVRTYLRAMWLTALRSFPLDDQLPAFIEIETLLAAVARTGESLSWFLQIWTQVVSKEADQHLVQFVTVNGAGFSQGRTLNEAFWAESRPQAIELREWLLRSDTLKRIRNAAPLLERDGFEHLFQPALDVLLNESSGPHEAV